MIPTLRKRISQHKYKLGVFALLSAASGVCLMLVLARILHSGGSHRYVTQVWNLLLAWIPFLLAYVAHALSWQRRLVYFVVPVFALLWLVFFPNAPYILTDLQHLSQESEVAPLWYDVILLVWFSWTGMLLGIVSLSLMQEIIRRAFGRLPGWVFVLGVAGLSSAGIYVGRFIRLNSWDVFQNPAESADNIWSWLSDPSLGSLGFIALYTLFFLFVYVILYAFGRMTRDHQPGDPPG